MKILTTFIDTGGQWHIGIFLGLCVSAVLVLRQYEKRIGWAATALWAYAVSSALYLIEYPSLPFGNLNTAFQATAGQSFAEMLLIPLAVLAAPKRIWNLVPVLCLVEIAAVWVHGKGLMGWPSFDNALIALCLPFVGPWVAIAALTTIVSFHGSTAILMALVEEIILIWCWAARTADHKRARAAGIAAAVILALLPVALYFRAHDLLIGAPDRLTAYHRYMAFWAESPRNIALGVGPGTFMWCSLMVDKFREPLFLAMHSDFLQILFEYGAVGFVLSLCVYFDAVCRSRTRPQILAAVFGIAIFSGTYMPLRYFPSSFLVCLILKEALCEKK